MVVAALPGWDNLRNALPNWLPHGLHAGMAPALLALQAVVCFAMLLLCPLRDYWKKQSTAPQPLPSDEPSAEELAVLTFLASLPTLVNTTCFPHSVWLTVGTIVLSLMTGVQTSRITSYGRHVLLSKRIETLPEQCDETQQTTVVTPPLPQLSSAAAVHGFAAVAALQEFDDVRGEPRKFFRHE